MCARRPRPLGRAFPPGSSRCRPRPPYSSACSAGAVQSRAGAQMCRRCGVRLEMRRRPSRSSPACPVCYRDADADGRLPSAARPGFRLDINSHIDEHDRFPVGTDAWLETLRPRPDPDRPMVGPVRPGPALPRDRGRRCWPEPAGPAQRDGHGDDPGPALGPEPGHLRRPGRVARGPRGRRRVDGRSPGRSGDPAADSRGHATSPVTRGSPLTLTRGAR